MSELTVTITTDYSLTSFTALDTVSFADSKDDITATFKASQFDGTRIVSALTINGAAHDGSVFEVKGISGKFDASGWTVNGWQATDFIRLIGGSGDDIITGTAVNDSLTGGAGTNRLDGGSGDDILNGFVSARIDGNDTMLGGDGGDIFVTNGVHDIMDGGAGVDHISINKITSDKALTLDVSSGSCTFGTGSSAVNIEGLTVLGGYADDRFTGGDYFDNLSGGGGDDVLIALGGDDKIALGSGSDTVDAGAGNDDISAGFSNAGSHIDGGAGVDSIEIYALLDTLAIDVRKGGAGRDIGNGTVLVSIEKVWAVLGYGNDSFMGGRFSDAVSGSDGIDKLSSFGGSDMLDGGAGNDRIQGGTGRDELAGGYDSDVFVYRSARESKAGAADVITDFASGEDRIDLAAIDADSRSASVNESFRFIGSGGFTTAGDLRITALGMLEADTDGDGDADFAIKLTGRPHLVESDFIL